MMRAPISVIVPTLNAEACLPMCLAGLGEGLAEGLIRELIISDGGSDDATLSIANSAGAEAIPGGQSLGGRLRMGAGVAQGDWLLFLPQNSVLQPGWTGAVFAALATPGAHVFGLDRADTGLRGVILGLRDRLRGAHPQPAQGLLIDRNGYAASGGFVDSDTGQVPDRLIGTLKPLDAFVQQI